MVTPEQGQQTDRPNKESQGRRPFPWRGLAIALMSIVGCFLLGLGVVYVLSEHGLIHSPWWRTVAPIFSLVGGWVVNNVFNKDFFQEFNKWLFHRDEENKSETSDKETSDKTAPPAIQQSPTIEQSPTITFNPTIIIDSSQTTREQPQPPFTDANHNPVESLQTLSVISNNGQPARDIVSNNGKKATETQQLLLDPGSIFLVNEQLTDPKEFYGRVFDRRMLIGRTRKGSSTSIVGPRRIGKTWLISYLRLVARTELGVNYQIGSLYATSPSCATVGGFVAKALKELDVTVSTLDHDHLQLTTLEKALEDLKSKNRIPILCVDEFEGFGNHPEFDINFFEGLRAIAEAGLLVLVVASKLPLIDIVSDFVKTIPKTSPFFNVFEQLTLKPFNSEEAKAFVQAKGNQAEFTEQEQKYLLRCGQQSKEQWPPLRLQFAGKMLLEDKQKSVSVDPNDPSYQWDFEKRLEDNYQAVVRI